MKKFISILLSMILILALFVPFTAFAAETEVIEISTYEDLLKIKDNPSGSFKLVKDIDAKGKTWTPVPFSGTFDGNGLAIMNLTISETGTNTRSSIDGNWKKYDTYFAGFFETLENATVKNLSLLGVNVDVTKNDNCYIGAIAGYIADSTVSGCTVNGTLSLTSDCKSFGVGGIVGYGWGLLDNCTADVTLICIDTNVTYKEEQFMGGAFANGYLDVTNCTINIDGYDSDHGYVHDGGLAGMYILPSGIKYAGKITNNTVTGSIHFFEDNTNRRAYCVGLVGEVMSWTFENKGNETSKFVRDEKKTYDKNLLPESCEKADYNKTVVEAKDGEYGYTLYECKTCDYSYKTDYTSLNVYVEPETTKAPEQKTTEEKTSSSSLMSKLPYIIITVIIIIGIIIAIIMLNMKPKKKRR